MVIAVDHAGGCVRFSSFRVADKFPRPVETGELEEKENITGMSPFSWQQGAQGTQPAINVPRLPYSEEGSNWRLAVSKRGAGISVSVTPWQQGAQGSQVWHERIGN
jgi:hypothetical protein